MNEWMSMVSAPKGFWINAKSKNGNAVAVIYAEPGYWESETGEYLADTSVVQGGLVQWAALPDTWTINDKGACRYAYPVYTEHRYRQDKGHAFQAYIRARKLEQHNINLKRPELAQGCKRKHEKLAEQYPDFPEAHESKERLR